MRALRLVGCSSSACRAERIAWSLHDTNRDLGQDLGGGGPEPPPRFFLGRPVFRGTRLALVQTLRAPVLSAKSSLMIPSMAARISRPFLRSTGMEAVARERRASAVSSLEILRESSL